MMASFAAAATAATSPRSLALSCRCLFGNGGRVTPNSGGFVRILHRQKPSFLLGGGNDDIRRTTIGYSQFFVHDAAAGQHRTIMTIATKISFNHSSNNIALFTKKSSSLLSLNNASSSTRRYFETEADYHNVADATLETIQDAIDEALGSGSSDKNGSDASAAAVIIEYECNLASGVLTLTLPPHGTWVLNKQTPNRQIWWSSPLSGPKRFEYDDKEIWFSTKDGLSLGPLLQQEIAHVTGRTIDLQL